MVLSHWSSRACDDFVPRHCRWGLLTGLPAISSQQFGNSAADANAGVPSTLVRVCGLPLFATALYYVHLDATLFTYHSPAPLPFAFTYRAPHTFAITPLHAFTACYFVHFTHTFTFTPLTYAFLAFSCNNWSVYLHLSFWRWIWTFSLERCGFCALMLTPGAHLRTRRRPHLTLRILPAAPDATATAHRARGSLMDLPSAAC